MTIHRLIPRRMSQEDEQPVVGIIPGRRDGAATGGADWSADRDRDVDSRMRFVHYSWAHLPARHETRQVEWPVRRNRRSRLIALRRAGPGCADRDRAHRGREIRIASDGTALARWGSRLRAEHLTQLLIVCFGAIQRGCELLYTTVLDAQPRHLPLESGYPGRVAEDRSRECEEQDDGQGNCARAPLPRLYCPAREPVLFGLKIAVGVDDNRDGAAALLCLRHPSNGAPRMRSSSRARSSFE